MATAVLMVSLAGFACSGGSGSVVSDAPQPAVSSTPGDAAMDARQQPVLPPGAVPTQPVGPVGQTSPSPSPAQSSAGQEEMARKIMGNLPITVTPAKPALTPAPDPFPPRPTPTIVLKDGQIVQQWQAPEDVAGEVNPVKSDPNAARFGREYYMQKCVDCHGKEGRGNGWMSKNLLRPPTNLASKMVQANTDGELFWKITKGKSPMPAHGVRFSDEQRWYIVAYLRTFKP